MIERDFTEYPLGWIQIQLPPSICDTRTKEGRPGHIIASENWKTFLEVRLLKKVNWIPTQKIAIKICKDGSRQKGSTRMSPKGLMLEAIGMQVTSGSTPSRLDELYTERTEGRN